MLLSQWCNPGTARDYLEDNEDMAVEIRIRLVSTNTRVDIGSYEIRYKMSQMESNIFTALRLSTAT